MSRMSDLSVVNVFPQSVVCFFTSLSVFFGVFKFDHDKFTNFLKYLIL